MWWNPCNSNWILDGEVFEPSDAKKIVEIDEKQIKRE
jgi:lipid-binding SYLF domain-containing protein